MIRGLDAPVQVMLRVLAYSETEVAGQLHTEASVGFYVFGREQTIVERLILFARFLMRFVFGSSRVPDPTMPVFRPDGTRGL